MHKFIPLLALIALTQFVPAMAQAQNKDSPITSEDAAIAFYKTAGIAPTVENWIKAAAPYNTTPAALRPRVMTKEKNRIIKKYNGYNPLEDILLIQTKVKPQLTITKLETGNLYYLKLQFVKAPDAFYFPYSYANNHFAIMPYGLRNAMETELSENQYNFLSKNLNSAQSYNLLLRLKAKESVSERPYKINGLDQWILKTSIGSIELWGKSSILWENHAEWYTAPTVEIINRLYETDHEPRQKFGTVKTFSE